MSVRNQKSAIFPWADVNRLATGLQDGELCLATALGQLGAVVRDSMKIIENYASEQMKLNLDRKLKLDTMDKRVKDLTEKCQCMQQALLYKEEKYDEKCREVERYKVICELSARSAVNDDQLYYASVDENNNNNVMNYSTNNTAATRGSVLGRGDATSVASLSTGKKVRVHEKIHTSQLRSHSRMPPPVPSTSRQVEPDVVPTERPYQVKRDEVSNMAAYYVGGPVRRPRKPAEDPTDETEDDGHLRDKLKIIGGINVSQSSRSGANPVKIALVGQRNEVISSSRNAAYLMRQKLTSKDLHRQVAEGPHNRLASRRKKEWPF